MWITNVFEIALHHSSSIDTDTIATNTEVPTEIETDISTPEQLQQPIPQTPAQLSDRVVSRTTSVDLQMETVSRIPDAEYAASINTPSPVVATTVPEINNNNTNSEKEIVTSYTLCILGVNLLLVYGWWSYLIIILILQ